MIVFDLFGNVKFIIDGKRKQPKTTETFIAFFLPLRGNPACNLTIKIISCVSIEWKSSGHRTTTGRFIAGCVSTICKAVDLFLCALSEKFLAWDCESLCYLLLTVLGQEFLGFFKNLYDFPNWLWSFHNINKFQIQFTL